MSFSKADLAARLVAAADSGSLVTSKHNPASASVAWPTGRSVLEPHVSASLRDMLVSGSFSAEEYQDPRFPNACYVITPSASYASLGSFIPSGSTGQTGSFDRLVAVDGTKQPWHVFAENQATLDAKQVSGSIARKGTVL